MLVRLSRRPTVPWVLMGIRDPDSQGSSPFTQTTLPSDPHDLARVSGPDNDRTIFPTSLCGPEILGPHNDHGVWSLSGPGRCLVLLHRCVVEHAGSTSTLPTPVGGGFNCGETKRKHVYLSVAAAEEQDGVVVYLQGSPFLFSDGRSDGPDGGPGRHPTRQQVPREAVRLRLRLRRTCHTGTKGFHTGWAASEFLTRASKF